MRAPAATTIAGVSVLTDGRPGEAFDLGLSPAGIEIRRPGHDPRLMSWDRVSEWEIEERAHDILLTLRGEGAATPLVITGWSFSDLDAVMRSVTSPASTNQPAPAVDEPVAAVPVVETAPEEEPSDTDVPPPGESRRERRRGRRRVGPKAVVTVVLLLVLATAVTLVLLQSAGVIHWSLLGPVA